MMNAIGLFSSSSTTLPVTNAAVWNDYTVDDSNSPRRSPSVYEWRDTGKYGECSVTCGQGREMTSVICRDRRTGNRVRDYYCANVMTRRPTPRVRACNLFSCHPIWKTDDWSPCSISCAAAGGRAAGVSTRRVYCVEELSDGTTHRTLDKRCRDPARPPATRRHCNVDTPCADWVAGPWSPCSVTCGTGRQERIVVCQTAGVIDCVMDDRPPTEAFCHGPPCSYRSIRSSESTSALSRRSSSSGNSDRRSNLKDVRGRYQVIELSMRHTRIGPAADTKSAPVETVIKEDDVIRAGADYRGTDASVLRNGDDDQTGWGRQFDYNDGTYWTPKDLQARVQADIMPVQRSEKRDTTKRWLFSDSTPPATSTTRCPDQHQFGSVYCRQHSSRQMLLSTNSSAAARKSLFLHNVDEIEAGSGEAEFVKSTTLFTTVASDRSSLQRGGKSLTSSTTTTTTKTPSAGSGRSVFLDSVDEIETGSGEAEYKEPVTIAKTDISGRTPGQLTDVVSAIVTSTPLPQNYGTTAKPAVDVDLRLVPLAAPETFPDREKFNQIGRYIYPRYRWQVMEQYGQCPTGCDASGLRNRRVECVARHRAYLSGSDVDGYPVVKYDVIVPKYYCIGIVRPIEVQQCESSLCPDVQWVAGDWSECSTVCGVPGTRRRQVRCVFKSNNSSTEDVSQCSSSERPPDEKPCLLPPCISYSCRDQSHFCGLVQRMSLCHLTLYRRRCCVSCRSSKRLRRRNQNEVGSSFNLN